MKIDATVLKETRYIAAWPPAFPVQCRVPRAPAARAKVRVCPVSRVLSAAPELAIQAPAVPASRQGWDPEPASQHPPGNIPPKRGFGRR